MKTNLRLIMLLLCLGVIKEGSATIYTVVNTNNNGAGSFSQAITDANANAGLDTIRFNIPDLGGFGQYFEGVASARYAVIRIISAIPVITDPLLIDGFSQANTNTGSIAGRTVGADNIVQPNINYPDVYILADVAGGYTRSTNTSNASRAYGNGININAINCTIRGVAISGFGNTSSSASTAGLSGDICILRSATVRTANTTITDCFIGTDARGAVPSPAGRMSLGAAVVIGGHNFNGTIARNYIRNTGTYGVHFNGGIDHASVGPGGTNLPNRNWVLENNQFIDISWNNSFIGAPNNFVTSGSGLVADAINTMNCKRLIIRNNYIENVEQVGIDLGWNADSNYVENNSITGFTKTYAGPVQCGIRAALSSRVDTIFKNRIYNNSGTAFRAGIWMDQSAPPAGPGLAIYDNVRHLISQNIINNNNSSGIVISTFTPTTLVNVREITITRNIIYNNTGLGIDLNFSGIAGPTSVTPNDNGDGDAGTNDLLNFPIIDSVRVNGPGNLLSVYGKAPADALLEFFYSDGGLNNHGGFALSYGESATFIGSAVEGSASDFASGTGSYNIDGNVAVNNVNMFRFVFPISGAPPAGTRLTATSTLNFSTSEYSPQDISGFVVLAQCNIIEFKGASAVDGNLLSWKAVCNKDVSMLCLEYSADGRNFLPLIINPGKDGLVESDYFHTQPESAVMYYRLKVVYQNGINEYSNIINIRNLKTVQAVKIAPIPFGSSFTVQIQSITKSELSISITDINGRRILSKNVKVEKGWNTVPFDQMQFLPSANYLLEIIDIPRSVRTVEWIKKQ